MWKQLECQGLKAGAGSLKTDMKPLLDLGGFPSVYRVLVIHVICVQVHLCGCMWMCVYIHVEVRRHPWVWFHRRHPPHYSSWLFVFVF